MSETPLRVVEKEDVNKNKALEAAITQIERSFGKGSVMRLGQRDVVQTEVFSTGSINLDIALGIGGLPRGRVVEVYGPESSGKTTLALHGVAEAQKAGGAASLIDVEHAFEAEFLEVKSITGIVIGGDCLRVVVDHHRTMTSARE